jgi:hypothetical protein
MVESKAANTQTTGSRLLSQRARCAEQCGRPFKYVNEREIQLGKRIVMTLEQRIGHLEKRCRRLTGVLVGTMAVTTVIVLSGAAPNSELPTVRTRQLEIVDGDGKVRIHLGKADEGYGVVVYDENRRHRATLTDAPRGAVMSLSKNGGDIRLMAMKGSAGVSVRDSEGKPRAVVFVTDDKSQIVLKDGQEKTVFSAPPSE